MKTFGTLSAQCGLSVSLLKTIMDSLPLYFLDILPEWVINAKYITKVESLQMLYYKSMKRKSVKPGILFLPIV